ncbi:hypothetical protein [Microvirga sp. KLBC 81]|uniref:hypothetical protein n=1 Tax=Microvirga sp. KLBC 81 TaxID=1862707 RepID=UPI001057D2EC|nr:hypothetical protein [Microvirga sp. KLBC 81]
MNWPVFGSFISKDTLGGCHEIGERGQSHHGPKLKCAPRRQAPRHARESILRVASKYFGRLNAASAHFSKEGITCRCSVTMQMGGLPMKSAESKDKAERTDKDAVLRERISLAEPEAESSTGGFADQEEQDSAT